MYKEKVMDPNGDMSAWEKPTDANVIVVFEFRINTSWSKLLALLYVGHLQQL
jgi:hypothetical protein